MKRTWTIIGVRDVPTSLEWYQSLFGASALRRARALVARFEEEPHVNPHTRAKEFSLRDPDGYNVTLSALAAIERRNAASRRSKQCSKPTKARGRATKTHGGRTRLRG